MSKGIRAVGGKGAKPVKVSVKRGRGLAPLGMPPVYNTTNKAFAQRKEKYP